MKKKNEGKPAAKPAEPKKYLLATEYASYYKLPPQGPNEADMDFQVRVATVLRADGKPIEAHEAYQNKRYEEGFEDGTSGVMFGVAGVIAQALQGKDPMFNRTGEHMLGDDVAIGVVATDQTPKMSPEEALFIALLLGNR